MSTEQKPPLGLRPESTAAAQFNRERIREIMLAIGRHLDANMTIPEAWMEELDRRLRTMLGPVSQLTPEQARTIGRS
jgi:hypothetical protein